MLDDPYRFGTIITDFDLHLSAEGTSTKPGTLGAHPATVDGVAGVRFAVWAPNAETVSVTGEFNDWDTRRHPMRPRDAGVWEIFMPGAREGDSYKYLVRSRTEAISSSRPIPYAFRREVPPKSASMICDLAGMSGATPSGWTRAASATG